MSLLVLLIAIYTQYVTTSSINSYLHVVGDSITKLASHTQHHPVIQKSLNLEVHAVVFKNSRNYNSYCNGDYICNTHGELSDRLKLSCPPEADREVNI